MQNATIICYLISLLSYGMGFSKTFILSDAVTATSYFVFAIFFAVIGFIFSYVRDNSEQKTIEIVTLNPQKRLVYNRRMEDRRAS